MLPWGAKSRNCSKYECRWNCSGLDPWGKDTVMSDWNDDDAAARRKPGAFESDMDSFDDDEF